MSEHGEQGEIGESVVMRRTTPEELRRLALWRHHEAALESAALLAALARYRVTDREPLYELQIRQKVRLIELLHDFCYHARKTIELAEVHKQGMIERAKGFRLLNDGRQADLGLEDPVSLADRSLWWLLGRVIHSLDIEVREHEEVQVGSPWAAPPRTTSYWMLVVVGIRSDFDGPDETNFVRVEKLVEAFCLLDRELREALDAASAF